MDFGDVLNLVGIVLMVGVAYGGWIAHRAELVRLRESTAKRAEGIDMRISQHEHSNREDSREMWGRLTDIGDRVARLEGGNGKH